MIRPGQLIAFLAIVAFAALALACDKKLDDSFKNLEVGDCIREEDAAEVDSVDEVDCDEPDVVRVVGKFSVTGYTDEYPGESVMDEEAVAGCPESMEFYLIPTEESWEEGDDREVVCFESS